jgi:CDP-paratose 2-epimerase
LKKILITGGEGLIGSSCIEFFIDKGWSVISVDNNMRGKIFGEEGSIENNVKISKKENLEMVRGDIRNKELMEEVIKKVDAIIHCAAQPSHPRSLEIPLEDFDINAYGTLLLLETVRKNNPKIPFVFLSTNKVYGDMPNKYEYKINKRRYDNSQVDSFDESMSIDKCGHTPFGVSKTAADLYCQEYAKNFGLTTCIFRCGCLTGKNSKAVEMHGYLPYIIKCAMTEKKYTIFGGGYRVRDQLHGSDVAGAAFEFIKNPKSDEEGNFGIVYNLGGSIKNSISIYETIDAIQEKTGKMLDFIEGKERESDHIWWITNTDKFKKDYPNWVITKDLDYIFDEIIEHHNDELQLNIEIKNKKYFKQ